MSADDEKAAPDIPPLPVELEVPMAPVIGEVAGEELPPLPGEMEEKASPMGGKASGEELPPLPPGMTKGDTAVRPTPVLRPQPVVSPAEPQGAPGSQAQKPEGKGAMVALILALIVCALYQGAQAWQAKQSALEDRLKSLQTQAEGEDVTQQAKEIQAHADRIIGLVKSMHEAERALKDIRVRQREFVQEIGSVDMQHSRRRAEAERALREAEERKRELKEKLKEGQS